MLRHVAVGDIMTRNFVSVKPTTSLLDCTSLFVKEKVNSLLVADRKRLIGILTQRDILSLIAKDPSINLKKISALDVATRKVAVIKPSADISQAFQKMKSYGFRRLPVISKGELVGLLTLKDILRIEPSLYNYTSELIPIREENSKLNKLKNEETTAEGLCDSCGVFADLLKVEDKFLCYDCREDLY